MIPTITIIVIFIFGGFISNFLTNVSFSYIYNNFEQKYIVIFLLTTTLPIIISCCINYIWLLFVVSKQNAYNNHNTKDLLETKTKMITSLIIIMLITIIYSVYKYHLNISTITTYATFSSGFETQK